MNRVRLNGHKQDECQVRLMLDSGAYSAWVKGETINIDEYIAFIKAKEHLIDSYINLDVIPGSPGSPRTPEMTEESAAASYTNLKYMEKHGLKPIPVFHHGEHMKWLEKMLSDGYDYIGIGARVEMGYRTARKWLDGVFTRLTTPDGLPIVKLHGFGLSSFQLMFRYPWFSCDASTWATVAGLGEIFVPKYDGTKFIYTAPPDKIKMSKVERGRDLPYDKSYFSMGPEMKGRVEKFLEEEMKTSVLRAVYDDRIRYKINACVLKKIGESLVDIRFEQRVKGFKFECA